MAIFDFVANDYDDWYKTKLGGFVDRVETDLAFSMFKPQKGMKILDVGCGTGNFSIKLAEMGCKVIGIDLSEEMLAIAKEKVKGSGLDIGFYSMDVYQLDFEDCSFDGVFSMAAFEFIKEPRKAFYEMYRVLRPEGQLLIGTIHKNSSWGRLYLSPYFQENTVFQHADFKTLDDLRNIAPEQLVESGECLFISPDGLEEEITIEREQELSKTVRGGYICALWQKEA